MGQFDRLERSQKNRMGFLPPIDTMAVQRELIGYFFEHPQAKTDEIVAEFKARYGQAVILQNLRRLEAKGYIWREKQTRPWSLQLGNARAKPSEYISSIFTNCPTNRPA